MNCSTPGLPVHPQLPEFTQTHVHRVADAIQPSHPQSLLLLTPIPPNIRVFSNESTLHMRWPKYWSFSFSISPSSEHPGLIFFSMDWLDLLAVESLEPLYSFERDDRLKRIQGSQVSLTLGHIRVFISFKAIKGTQFGLRPLKSGNSSYPHMADSRHWRLVNQSLTFYLFVF